MKKFLYNLSRYILENHDKYYQEILERDTKEIQLNKAVRANETIYFMYAFPHIHYNGENPEEKKTKRNDYINRNSSLYLEQEPSKHYDNKRSLVISQYGIINLIGILAILFPEKYKEVFLPDLQLPNFNSKKLLSYTLELNEDLKNKNFCYCSINSLIFINPTLKISTEKLEALKNFANIPVLTLKGLTHNEFEDFVKDEFLKRSGTDYSFILNSEFFKKELIIFNYITFIGYFKQKLTSTGYGDFTTSINTQKVPYMQNKGNYKYFTDNLINAVEVELFSKNKGFSLILVQPKNDFTVDSIYDNTMQILLTVINFFNKNDYRSIDLTFPKFDIKHNTDAGECIYKLKMKSLSEDARKNANVLDINDVCTARQHCTIRTFEHGININENDFDKTENHDIPEKLQSEILKIMGNRRSKRFLPKSEIYDKKNSISVNFNRPFCAYLVDRDIEESNPDAFMLLVSIKFLGPDKWIWK